MNRWPYARLSDGADNEIDPGSFEGQAFPLQDRSKPAASAKTSNPNILYTNIAEDDQAEGLETYLVQPRPSTIPAHAFKTGARLVAFTALAVLFINTGVLIWAAVKGAASDPFLELYRGDCTTAARIDLFAHLIINLLATALLSGGNFCMQCLSAPTRADVDRAHAEGEWLDIGVSGTRNLCRIPKSKMWAWWILSLSSIPIHLMYNSTIFSSLSTNTFTILSVTDAFLHGGSFTLSGSLNDPGIQVAEWYGAISYGWNPPVPLQAARQVFAGIQDRQASFDRLNNTDCILTNETNANNSILAADFLPFLPSLGSVGWDEYNPYAWMCSDPELPSMLNRTGVNVSADIVLLCQDHVGFLIDNSDLWSPYGHKVEYCLAEKITESCGVHVSFIVLAVVIACNIGKVTCMLWVACRDMKQPLVTLGDAIASFLEKPDTTTSLMCLRGRQDFDCTPATLKSWDALRIAIPWYTRIDRRLGATISRKRWVFTLASIVLCNVAIVSCLVLALSGLPTVHGFRELWNMGFGQADPLAIVSGWSLGSPRDAFGNVGATASPTSSLATTILVANLPQAILSFVYLLINGVLTSIFSGIEWNRFGKYRKTLRVSQPSHGQRKSYFLQLPYKAGLPLLGVSVLLHWVVSQSFFLLVVRQDSADDPNNTFSPPKPPLITCGFSPIAIMISLLLSVLVSGALVVIGLLKVPIWTSVVGSCSAAISAACHLPEHNPQAAYQPLQWGVVPDNADNVGQIGHCCFSDKPVLPPESGRNYA